MQSSDFILTMSLSLKLLIKSCFAKFQICNIIFICSKEQTLLRETDDVSTEKKRKIRVSFGHNEYRAVSPREGIHKIYPLT